MTTQFLTTSQLAAFCEVDAKTIHNWVNKGAIAHFQTPGGHLRFTRRAAREFMRRIGMPIPEGLRKEGDAT